MIKCDNYIWLKWVGFPVKYHHEGTLFKGFIIWVSIYDACISGTMHVTGWLLGEDGLESSYLFFSWYVWFLEHCSCTFLLHVKFYLLICAIGLTIQANVYYKMLIGWTSQKIKDSHAVHNPFDFKHGMVQFFKS